MEQKRKNVSAFSNKSRNAYVVEHLTAAMLELLEEKPLEEISVSELCDQAGVGRTSFYRNFETREAVLTARLRRMLEDWSARWAGEKDVPIHTLVFRLFSHFEEERTFYSLLSRRGQVCLLKNAILDLCHFEPQGEALAAYASAYAAYALYGWVEVWFLRGMKESPEEMAALFTPKP